LPICHLPTICWQDRTPSIESQNRYLKLHSGKDTTAMAQPSDVRTTVLALHRFGLGARPGDLGKIGTGIRDALAGEVAAKTVLQPQGLEFVRMAALGPAFNAFQEDERKMREARVANGNMANGNMATPGSMDGMTAPPAPATNAPVPATPSAPGAPSSTPATAPARTEPPLPQRVYRDEAKARVHLANEPLVGFSERLVQFWSNHFCVSVAKGGMVRAAAGVFEREAIRPHVFGRFADMLWAVVSSPAMLVYLDNQQSIGPGSKAGQRRGRGLNENLAREIMELHTLGVAGGYTQGDVTSLARILTGWTVVGREGNLGPPGTFVFNANLHEPGDHVIIGKTYRDNGLEQGREALNGLARHPSTARHIARKLARHFVADEPPAALVARLAKTFAESDGDLQKVSMALVEAPEAWTPQATKMRSPQEFLVAAMRALARKPEAPQILGPLNAMGQQIWQPSGPNGFSDTVATWATAEGMKTRLDVAAAIARQVAPGTVDPRTIVDEILGSLASNETRQAVARAESKPQALALFLMSPEFQRR
jgi:uncharacterized protein (DUF1800 family)